MTRLLDVTHRGVQVLQVGCQGPLVHCRRGRVSRAGWGGLGLFPQHREQCGRGSGGQAVCLSVCTALPRQGGTTRLPCWDQQVTRSSWCSLLEKPGLSKGAWNAPRTGAHRIHGDGHPGIWEGTAGTQDSRTRRDTVPTEFGQLGASSDGRVIGELGQIQIPAGKAPGTDLPQAEIYSSRPEFAPLFVQCSPNSQGNCSGAAGDGVQGEGSSCFVKIQCIV